MDETSDLGFCAAIIGIACLIFAAGAWLGSWHVKKQYEYGCSPEVLVAYTEGYQECKEGK